MPHIIASAGRRPIVRLLSASDLACAVREAEDIDAPLDESVDLLPLGALIRLTERSRAA